MNNRTYKVVYNRLETDDYGNMALITTVYQKPLNSVFYVITDDCGATMATLDYITHDLDGLEDINHCKFAEQELPVDKDLCPNDDDFELYDYCHQQFIKQCCRAAGPYRWLYYTDLPTALKQLITSDYKDWLIDNNQLVETDGEQIIVNDHYTPPAEEHEQYIKDCKELLSYMEAEFEKTDVENPDDAWEQFYTLPATIGFGGRQVVLVNQASVYTALTEALEYIISQE